MLKTNILQSNRYLTFGRKPNDYAYKLLKNPNLSKDNYERNVAIAFNIENPDWENNPYWLHKMKQDTKGARLLGVYHTGVHDYEFTPLSCILCNILGITITSYYLFNKKAYKELNTFLKTAYSIALPAFIYSTIDQIKYVLTGRYLFEKKQKQIKDWHYDNFTTTSIALQIFVREKAEWLYISTF